jgi:hypothetical protein
MDLSSIKLVIKVGAEIDLAPKSPDHMIPQLSVTCVTIGEEARGGGPKVRGLQIANPGICGGDPSARAGAWAPLST